MAHTWKRYVTVLSLSLAANAGAQAPIPIRKIGPILATSTENVGQAVIVRATSNGHVIVGAGSRQRVYAFDSTLRNFTLVADSGSGTGVASMRPIGLIPFLGDSTLLPDGVANALLVLDGTGKQVRSMAPPRAGDLDFLGSPVTFGRPGLDSKGRLIYRASLMKPRPPKMTPPGKPIELFPVNADSAPVVRGDFDTRHIDTLAWMKVPSQGKMGSQMMPNPGGGPPTITMHLEINPFAVADEWSLLSDGTIAIVRAHDYHIDWIDPDGTIRSSPKMPMDWRKYTDAERTHIADSLRSSVEEVSRKNAARPAGSVQIKVDVSVVPASEFPSFWPPIEAGSVMSDLDGHVWILPTTSTNVANGFTYDVVNRKGEITERVQLPKGYVLVGFGPRNMVYMTKADGKNTYLARAVLGARPR